MRHLLSTVCLVALLLAGLSAPALAGEWVDGDGYRFRLPEGFQAVDAGNVPGGGFNMSFGGGLGGSDLEMEMKAFARSQAAPEQGMLMVMRIMATGELGRQFRDQMSFENLQRQLEQDRDAAAAMMGQRGIDLDEMTTTTLGASHQAIVMSFVQHQPGMGEVKIRMAMTTYEECVYMFMLMGTMDNETQDAVAWSTLTTSIQLSSPNRILRFAKKNWPYLLGAVVVLLFLILNLRGRSSTRRYRPAYASRTTASGGLSRAMDGLPTYDEAQAEGAGAGYAAPPPSPSPSPAAPAQGAPSRTLHRPGSVSPAAAPPSKPAPPSPYGGSLPPASGPVPAGKRTIPLSKVEDDARGIVAARERRLRSEAEAASGSSAEANPRIQGNWTE